MPDGHLEDERRLQHVLDELAGGSAPATAAGRVIFENGAGNALASVLGAIDETVLPRRLTFATGEARTLCCEVAERRIMRVANDPPLSKADAVSAAAQIEAFSASASVIHLRSEIVATATTSGEVGVSVAELLSHIATDAIPRDITALIETALSESASYALAIVDRQLDGRVREKGQSTLCEKLQQMEAAFHTQPDGLTRQIWIGAPDEDFAILQITSSDRCIWMAFEVEHFDSCINIWSRLG